MDRGNAVSSSAEREMSLSVGMSVQRMNEQAGAIIVIFQAEKIFVTKPFWGRRVTRKEGTCHTGMREWSPQSLQDVLLSTFNSRFAH